MKIVLFGASGRAGGGVLKACLAASQVEEVRAITRRPLAITNDKLRTFLHTDFLDYQAVADAFAEVDACLYCLGISSTQASGEAEYRKITYEFALAAAHLLKLQSPEAIFHFISGRSTSLNSRFMWARVKAETESDLMKLMKTVCWRPAYIDGELSANSPWSLRLASPLLNLLKAFPNLYVKAEDIGRAMLQATRENMHGQIIENAEIRAIADACH